MAHSIHLRIASGSLQGKEAAIRLAEGVRLENGEIVVTGHDALVFGRSEDCQICLPQDDGQVSRHHFIMEVNPPAARIRDFGSLNGTYVNGKKIGSRGKGETPEEGRKRPQPLVDLKTGDQIQVGKTVLSFRSHLVVVCHRCGDEISEVEQPSCRWLGETFLCAPCRQKAEERAPAQARFCADCHLPIAPGAAKWGGRHEKLDYCEDCWVRGRRGQAPARERLQPEPPRCRKCQRNVEPELAKGCRGDYVCEECRRQVENDPAELLYQVLREAGLIESGSANPAVPGYELEKRLGKGGYGVVYLARNLTTRAEVAIKVMLAKVAVSEKVRRDFLREIAVTKDLQHPNVVSLLDHGAAGATFYFVMEYCRLGNVNRLLRQHGRRLPLGIAAPIMLDVLEGLAYCHERNIVHRDLKPDNILLTEEYGRRMAKIADLGLAKNFETAGLSGMTVTGQYAGTFEFMPREQLVHFKTVRPASDIWSVGATFYNLLTGCLPRDFPENRDPADVVIRDPAVPLRAREPGLPKAVAAVIDRALSTEVGDRYRNAGEMKAALSIAL
jgi:serine/threonine-protein kinase